MEHLVVGYSNFNLHTYGIVLSGVSGTVVVATAAPDCEYRDSRERPALHERMSERQFLSRQEVIRYPAIPLAELGRVASLHIVERCQMKHSCQGPPCTVGRKAKAFLTDKKSRAAECGVVTL